MAQHRLRVVFGHRLPPTRLAPANTDVHHTSLLDRGVSFALPDSTFRCRFEGGVCRLYPLTVQHHQVLFVATARGRLSDACGGANNYKGGARP